MVKKVKKPNRMFNILDKTNALNPFNSSIGVHDSKDAPQYVPPQKRKRIKDFLSKNNFQLNYGGTENRLYLDEPF